MNGTPLSLGHFGHKTGRTVRHGNVHTVRVAAPQIIACSPDASGMAEQLP